MKLQKLTGFTYHINQLDDDLKLLKTISKAKYRTLKYDTLPQLKCLFAAVTIKQHPECLNWYTTFCDEVESMVSFFYINCFL